ncbi:MAG: amino acid ABC transporter substrate-binding protein [Proteobacteria bacterium]|uniref:Amino acid ABC transporter substrate-binding protein n=1 Tax=Candidatus Avisuccinivibrio stercorigallinarum TaxID=2840704 RepID=A0A9D9DCC0_9GAMM|nr:amino acid ABC transporter substrate-binding protein [Candidatus Avisuccinivibrio stercorigallinarum]
MHFSFKHLAAAAAAVFLSLQPLSAQADGELSGVSLRVYLDPVNCPFAFFTDNVVKPVGLDADIIYELQKRLGFHLQDERIYPLMRGDQFELLRRGEADIIGGGMSATEDRAKFMDFSPIYFDTGMAVLYSKKLNPGIRSYQDLEGKTVMVPADSSAEVFARENLPNSKIEISHNITLSYFAVAYGKVDAVIYDRPILTYFADTMPSLNLAVTDETLARNESQYTFGLQPGSPYNRYFMQAFNAIKEDGTLDKLKAKWGLSAAEAK